MIYFKFCINFKFKSNSFLGIPAKKKKKGCLSEDYQDMKV